MYTVGLITAQQTVDNTNNTVLARLTLCELVVVAESVDWKKVFVFLKFVTIIVLINWRLYIK